MEHRSRAGTSCSDKERGREIRHRLDSAPLHRDNRLQSRSVSSPVRVGCHVLLPADHERLHGSLPGCPLGAQSPTVSLLSSASISDWCDLKYSKLHPLSMRFIPQSQTARKGSIACTSFSRRSGGNSLRLLRFRKSRSLC